VKSILTIRHKFYQDKKEREREHRRKTRTNRSPSRSEKNEAYKILGISDFSTSFDEVKKAYRDLAKKHHPDRFFNSREEEQEKANERFAVINGAYEYLEIVLA
jgi:DnaJ-class molecular chaperone